MEKYKKAPINVTLYPQKYSSSFKHFILNLGYFSLNFYFILYNNMCTYNTISSHTDHFEMQKRDSEESLLTFVNLFLGYETFLIWTNSLREITLNCISKEATQIGLYKNQSISTVIEIFFWL